MSEKNEKQFPPYKPWPLPGAGLIEKSRQQGVTWALGSLEPRGYRAPAGTIAAVLEDDRK